jgi:hypothetical protein
MKAVNWRGGFLVCRCTVSLAGGAFFKPTSADREINGRHNLGTGKKVAGIFVTDPFRTYGKVLFWYPTSF